MRSLGDFRLEGWLNKGLTFSDCDGLSYCDEQLQLKLHAGRTN